MSLVSIKRWMFVIFLLYLAGCGSTPSSYISTYTTYQGGLYQISLSGEKQEIVPPNNIHKSLLAWSPNRTILAYIEDKYTPKWTESLFVVNADGSDVRRLFGPANPLLYSWEDDRTLYVEEAVSYTRIPFDTDSIIKAYLIDVTNGAVHETQKKQREKPTGYWSPDHQKLADTNSTEPQRPICVLFVATQSQKCFDAQWAMNVVAWSPDSRYIVYLGKTADDEPDLFAIDTTSGVITNLTKDGNNGLEADIAR